MRVQLIISNLASNRLAVSRSSPNPPSAAGGERRYCLSPNAKIMLLASPNSRLPHGSVTARKCNGPTSPWSTRLPDRESPPSQLALHVLENRADTKMCNAISK
ncbi:unnamed protein product [Cercopithifilaria johnstoni]|uniref:Uncharacterized protein n=1 Tax=Cercopithifilaria johnstoni TaxID=2874296 RepID=A0A8J2MAH8_9BILA|nr:unnamed protein product [Cercopithifilaria johnstoni]